MPVEGDVLFYDLGPSTKKPGQTAALKVTGGSAKQTVAERMSGGKGKGNSDMMSRMPMMMQMMQKLQKLESTMEVMKTNVTNILKKNAHETDKHGNLEGVVSVIEEKLEEKLEKMLKAMETKFEDLESLDEKLSQATKRNDAFEEKLTMVAQDCAKTLTEVHDLSKKIGTTIYLVENMVEREAKVPEEPDNTSPATPVKDVVKAQVPLELALKLVASTDSSVTSAAQGEQSSDDIGEKGEVASKVETKKDYWKEVKAKFGHDKAIMRRIDGYRDACGYRHYNEELYEWAMHKFGKDAR
jgi:hypothetical protein